MVCACGSLGYQVFYTSTFASDAARLAYLATVVCGCSCYLVARRYSFKYGNYNVSSAMHCGLHLFGNLGNVLLYDSLGANYLRLR